MCPLKVHMLKSPLEMVWGGRAFGKELGHESRTLMNGTSALLKRNVGDDFFFSAM